MKDYLRVDGNDEDSLIEGFILAAKEYLTGAGVGDSVHGGLYDIVVKMLVAVFYENRDTVEKQVNVPPIINNFIAQLAIKSQVEG